MDKRTNWIKTMRDKLREEGNRSPKIIDVIAVGRRVAVINLVTKAIGVATCSPTDEYDSTTGMAIAYARMKGWGVPDYVINGTDNLVCVSTLKAGQRFRYGGNIYHFIGKAIGPDTFTVYNETKSYFCTFGRMDEYSGGVYPID